MTNAEIIMAARMELAKAGKLEIINGEPQEIHTYNAWKRLGFQVLKGQKAVCMLRIWKPIPKKGTKPVQIEDEEDNEQKPWMMPKNAFFFSASQVDSIV